MQGLTPVATPLKGQPTIRTNLSSTERPRDSNLKAQIEGTVADSSEITGKIRALGDDIRRYVEASKETERLLASD